MTTITKKQASLALIVVAFAAVMIAGPVASSADNSVFAKKHKHGKHASVNQGISLSDAQYHKALAFSSSVAASPVTTSGNNAAFKHSN